jgi:uncharacterized membrane protein YdbT with pleckstrin-like domain
MSYIEKNLVPGEKLLYQTRHHWIVLLGPLFFGLLLGVPGIWLLAYSAEHSKSATDAGTSSAIPASIPPQALAIAGGVLLAIALAVVLYGVAKRNATEMAVTNKRVFIKAGMASRRTFDLMLPKIESIGVEETVMGRMLGFGTVIVRGTGGTPEAFDMIGHPQEFRRQVQQQLGTA